MSKNRNEPYEKVLALKNSISEATTAAKNQGAYAKAVRALHPKTEQAANDLIKDLNGALATWKEATEQNSTKTKNGTEYSPIIQKKIDDALIKTCQTSVSKHKNNLMHAPSTTWEKIKSAVNNFVRWCNGRSAAEVKLSPIASDRNKSGKKNHGEEMREKIKEVSDYKSKGPGC